MSLAGDKWLCFLFDSDEVISFTCTVTLTCTKVLARCWEHLHDIHNNVTTATEGERSERRDLQNHTCPQRGRGEIPQAKISFTHPLLSCALLKKEENKKTLRQILYFFGGFGQFFTKMVGFPAIWRAFYITFLPPPRWLWTCTYSVNCPNIVNNARKRSYAPLAM